MRRIHRLSFALGLSALLTVAAAPSAFAQARNPVPVETSHGTRADSSLAQPQVAPQSGSDVEFIQSALRTSLAEVELAKLAQSRSGNPKLRDYAKMLSADHTKSIQELKGLLATVNVVAPESPSVEAKAVYDELAKLSGPQFDAGYLELMVESHEEAIEQYGAQTHANDNKELAAVASRSLPVLKQHLASANELLSAIAHQ